jgi:hypothetical protein
MSQKPSRARHSKNKGKGFQNEVRDKIYQYFPHLPEGDVKSTTMGEQGVDIQLSHAAQKVFPYAVECKRKKAFAIYAMYEQAEANKAHLEPLLIIRGDRKKALVVVDLDHFLELVKNGK